MDVTEATFAREVVEASRERPVIVDFWAPWCGPCRVLGPVLERVVDEYDGAVRLTKVNTDDNPSLSAAFDIRGIPAVMAFVDGQMVNAFTGAIGESGVRAFVASVATSPHAETLVAARAQFERHRFEEARDTLARIPYSDAAHAEADRLLARIELAEAASALGRGSEETSSVGAPTAVAAPSGSPDAEEREFERALRALASGDIDDGLARTLDMVAGRGTHAERARELAVLAFRTIDDPDVVRLWQGRLSAVLF